MKAMEIKYTISWALIATLLMITFSAGDCYASSKDSGSKSTSFGLYQDQSQSQNQEASNNSFFSSSSRLRGFDNGDGSEGGEDPFEEGPVEDAYPVILLLLAAYAVFKWRSVSKSSEG